MKKEITLMSELTPAKRRDLRAQAHHLDPVVSVSANGLTASVLKEIDTSLKAHELIKIRVYGDDRDTRVAILEEICATLGCEAIQHIGKLLIVFRHNPELHKPKPALKPSVLPAALRKQEPRRPGSRQTVGTSAARRLTAPRRAPSVGRTARSPIKSPSKR